MISLVRGMAQKTRPQSVQMRFRDGFLLVAREADDRISWRWLVPDPRKAKHNKLKLWTRRAMNTSNPTFTSNVSSNPESSIHAFYKEANELANILIRRLKRKVQNPTQVWS